MEDKSIDELYAWINSRYEEYTNGDLSEETYLKDLDFYKQKLAVAETPHEEKTVKEKDNSKSVAPKKVRSTSIAGLRKKLLDEMKK